MALKFSQVFSEMINAVKASLGKDWGKAKDYANPEIKRLAQSLIDISKLTALGKINQQEAKALIQIHKNTTQMVFLTVEGLGIIAVENAINAALDVVKKSVNAVAGIKIV